MLGSRVSFVKRVLLPGLERLNISRHERLVDVLMYIQPRASSAALTGVVQQRKGCCLHKVANNR